MKSICCYRLLLECQPECCVNFCCFSGTWSHSDEQLGHSTLRWMISLSTCLCSEADSFLISRLSSQHASWSLSLSWLWQLFVFPSTSAFCMWKKWPILQGLRSQEEAIGAAVFLFHNSLSHLYVLFFLTFTVCNIYCYSFVIWYLFYFSYIGEMAYRNFKYPL